MLHGTIFVFAKPPRLGETKTRLAQSIGDSAALQISRALLHDAVQYWRSWPGWNVRLSTPETDVDHGICCATVWQGGGTLGHRIRATLNQSTGWRVAVGADIPPWPAELRQEFVSALEAADVVFVPVADGGFGAIACRCALPSTIEGSIRWSTEYALLDTVQALTDAGLHVALTRPWLDVDVASDLQAVLPHLPMSSILRGLCQEHPHWLSGMVVAD